MNALVSMPWFDALLVLAAGSTLVGLLALAASLLTSHARWQRAIWQTSVLALTGLVLLEMCGVSAGLQATLRMAGREPTNVENEPAASALRRTVEPAVDMPWEAALIEEPLPALATLDAAVVVASDLENPAAITATNSPNTPSSAPLEPSHWALDLLVPIVWATGALALLLRLVVGQVLLIRFARRHRTAAAPERLAALARRVGLRGKVRVVRAEALRGPVAFGLLRPTLGLPCHFEREFSGGEQDAMLAHELAHLANHDPAWKLLCDMTSALLWWQPLTWVVRSRLQAACEVAADEACLVIEDGPELLAGCLLALAKRVSPAASPAWLAVEGSGFRSSLGRRVSRLLSLPARCSRPARTNLGGICLVGAVAALAATLASTAWARPRAALTGDTSMKNLFVSSWRQSLAGGLLLAVLGPAAPAVADDEPRREERPAAERREGDRDRPPAREGERRDGERRDGERRDGERREGDRPAAERREGDRPPMARRDGDRPGPNPPRDGDDMARRMQEEHRKMEQRMKQLRGEMAEHTRAGREDAANRVEKEIQELTRRVEQMRRAAAERGDRPPEGRRPEGDRRPDGERRPEGDRRPDGPPEGRRGDGPPPGRPGFAPGGPPRDELLSVLRDLRAEVQNLRQEVNDLKARMRDMGPRGEGARPRPEGERPRGEGERPRGEGERPRGEGERPRPEAARPR